MHIYKKDRIKPYLSNFRGVSQPSLTARGSSMVLVKSKTTKFRSRNAYQ